MVKVGFVGIGNIALDYLELINENRVPDMQVGALCAHSEDSLSKMKVNAPWLNCIPSYTDYNEFLESGLFDGVIICTPHGKHPTMTMQALQKGYHVLCEKPIGIDMQEVDAVKSYLIKHPNLQCGINYNRRKSKAFNKIKDLMDQGIIGELVRATWVITNLYRTEAYYHSSPWRGKWSTEGGGILMTQASHQIDLMQWICGMPVKVMARCITINRDIDVENEAELFLDYANGAHGYFIASAHECPGTNRFEICGTKGRITITEDSEVEIIRLSQDEPIFAKTCSSPFEKAPFTQEYLQFDDSADKIQQAAMLQDFAEAVVGKHTCACTYEEGSHSLEIIQGAYLSSWLEKAIHIPTDRVIFKKYYQKACEE